jgi:hypothetical protein
MHLDFLAFISGNELQLNSGALLDLRVDFEIWLQI